MKSDISNREILKKVLIVGPNIDGQGGISSVLKSYKQIYEHFNYVSTNTSKQRFKLLRNIVNVFYAISKIICYKWFDGVKVIHFHGASGKSFSRKSLLIKIAYMLGYKIIFHCHGADFARYAQLKGVDKVGKTLYRCSAVVVLSKTWKKYFEATYGLRNVYIINNIVEPRDVEPEVRSDEFMTLLFLGQIGDRKGIFDLLDVIAANRDDFENRIKLIVGGDGDIARFNDVVSSNSLENIVEYVGWISGDDKKRLLSKCDVVVLPSYSEGLPIFILEAMAYSKPVISTTVGGIPEIVANAENGILIEPGDENALYHAIKYYMDNPDKIINEGRCSQHKVEPFYPESVKSQLIDLYTKLLNKI